MSKERPSVGPRRTNPQIPDTEPLEGTGGPVLTYRRMTPAPGSSAFSSTRTNNVPVGALCQRCRERPAQDGTYCFDCAEIQNSLSKIVSEIKTPGKPSPPHNAPFDASMLRRQMPEGSTPSPSELQRSSSMPGGSLFDELLEEVKQIQEPARPAPKPMPAPTPPSSYEQERPVIKGADLSSLHKLGAVGAAAPSPSGFGSRAPAATPDLFADLDVEVESPAPSPAQSEPLPDLFAEDDAPLPDLFSENDAPLPDLFSEDDAPLPALFSEDDAPLPDLFAEDDAPVRGAVEGAAGTLRHSPDKPLARDLPVNRPSPSQYIQGAPSNGPRRGPRTTATKPVKPLSQTQAHDVDSLLLDLIQVGDAPPPPPRSPLRIIVYLLLTVALLGAGAGLAMFFGK